MVLSHLTFMVDPTINLMSGPHHECERGSTIFHTLGVPKNYSSYSPFYRRQSHSNSTAHGVKSYQLRAVLALLIVVNMSLIKVLCYKFQAYSIDFN